jgi:uncharacterized phage protein gp47/JayE
MATIPLATLAPTVSGTGISAPSYNDIYLTLVYRFQQIYGSDIYISPDSQDGQWLGILAQGYYDCGQAAVKAFQSFSPTYAQGAGLSSLVKLTGITREVATHSTATVTVVGHGGATILNGVVADAAGNLWNLPASVTIPTGGSIDVTATAQAAGNISAVIGAINVINNPQLGWQSVTNAAAATAGAPIESDATLRVRQYKSTAISALGIKESIFAVVSNLPGVTSCLVHDNDTGATDADGVPAHSIAVIVGGGAIQDVVDAIGETKPPGAQTYGPASGIYTDQYGLTTPINFYQLALIPIFYAVTIQRLDGFDSVNTPGLIQAALANYTNQLLIGEDVYFSQAMAAAGLPDASGRPNNTFYITSFTLGFSAGPIYTNSLPIGFAQQAQGVAVNAAITVV